MFIKDKVSKLFNCISKWSMSVPINPVGNYRYNGVNTIYESTTCEDGFNPSEREILVYRYANRYFNGQYVRFHLTSVDKHYKVTKDSCWTYAIIGTIVHGNNTTNYGYLEVEVICANTMTHKKILIKPNTLIECEIIPKAWFDELVKMVKLN
jgi:hypothetical protein